MEEGPRSSAILMGLVCALARGVLRGVVVVVGEICSSDSFQILLWLVVIMRVELRVG